MSCTWIDDLELDPLDGDILYFTIISDGERLRYCMPQTLARQVSNKTKRMLDSAEVMRQLDREVVPIFGRS